jgi:radical SAM superfamily enzyme YgiQ (UPF0313 family)
MSLRVVLVQLPIPPLGPEPVTGNVPLAAGYLKYYAQYVHRVPADIEILPPSLADRAGDAAILRAIIERQPDIVGFSCYVWNAERSLWLAQRIKELRPQTRIVVGGPEATSDNAWFLNHPAVDWAVLGEGEETFAELLATLADFPRLLSHPAEAPDIPGTWNRHRSRFGPPRPQLRSLDAVGRVYLDGMIDPRWHNTLLLESIRGCIFHCSFCFYPKSFDRLTYMSREVILENLRLAERCGVAEVFLLDPTLNQRRDFEDFLHTLREGNPRGRFTYSGELRAEGIRPELAQLMRSAGFVEVELGLQSVGRTAQDLMHRRVNLPAFERGVQALMDAGIHVRVDLIIGLPGDTAETVRKGIAYLTSSGLYHEPQVFRLSVLPGTEFRRRSTELGLEFQPRPPYHVLSTPTLKAEEIQQLMAEAEQAFNTDFDPLPIANDELSSERVNQGGSVWRIDLDEPSPAPSSDTVDIAHTLWITAREFADRSAAIVPWVRRVLGDNPHTSLWVVLDVTGADSLPATEDIFRIMDALHEQPPTYWDWHLALHPKPGRLGAKRIVIYSARRLKGRLARWRRSIEQVADIVENTQVPQKAV